MSPMVESLNNF